ncbi:Tim44 domain-containing protein [Sphingomonas cavernae]|uniref:Preprotein translocase subunit Tim44 n=1 Tax=Sphingomonas cavernae TaxID=2320861 RepID=A0A418W620_9SPHN|nr:TIM44-like domain-containing protein [Sphingomonas cavernae]RJF85367.1 preprotein translocase subunit Tim44 [Sphingomonas cavernae]
MSEMKFRNISAITMCLAVFVMAATPADARRGGSFGSRGSRTAVAPPATATAPNQVAPVQRTMTNKPAPATAAAPNARAAAGAPARSGGMMKGLIGGLIAGGLIGMLLGNGFGALNGSGILMALLQAALIGGLIWFALRMFRRRPAMAAAGAPNMTAFAAAPETAHARAATPAQPQFYTASSSRDIAITMDDKMAFERLLGDVQDAFSREDYAGLRACTTPEVMSYLAEELGQNATQGQRNEVSGTELLNAEVAEAWSESGADYATIAMEYQSIDVMRDRNSGALIAGDPAVPSRTTELWTFVKDASHPWRLSAIQQA